MHLWTTPVWLFVWLAKSFVLLAGVWLLSRLARPSDARSAAVRHALWLAAVGGSALLATAPLWPRTRTLSFALALPAELIAPGAADAPRLVSAGRPMLSLAALAAAIWAAGALVLLARIALRQARVGRWLRAARPASNRLRQALGLAPTGAAENEAKGVIPLTPASLRDAARVFVLDGLTTPLVFGVLRPIIVLPAVAEGWPEATLDAALAHELGHVARRDCATQLLAELHCAFAWPNPLAWLAARRMSVERELACDERVLNSGARPSDYARLLLSLAHPQRPGAAAMAHPATLAVRVEALLAERRRGHPALTGAAWLLLAALSLTLACERQEAAQVGKTFDGGAHDVALPAELEIEADSPAPEGSLAASVIKQAMQEHKAGFRQCYERELKRSAELNVRAQLHFTIGATGLPQEIAVDPIAEAPELGPCLMRVVTELTFPAPKGGGVVRVNYPLVFKSSPPTEVKPEEVKPEEVKPTVNGPKIRLDRNDVLTYVKANKDPIARCTSRAANGPLPGKLILKWTILPSGVTQSQELANAELKGTPLEACVVAALKEWRFPQFQEGTIPVTFPLIIK